MSEFYQTTVREGWNLKYPEQVSVAATIDEEGNPNALALGWVMVTSHEPPMMAISVGHNRYSYELLQLNREFVLAFPDEKAVEKVKYVGSRSGREVKNKLQDCGWETAEPAVVRPPLLRDCLVNFECRVVGEIKTGDHTIFAGKIVATHVSRKPGKRIYNFGSGVIRSIKHPEQQSAHQGG